MDSLEQLISLAQQDFRNVSNPVSLENAKAKYLGKTGLITAEMKMLGKMAPEERKARGAVMMPPKAKSKPRSMKDVRNWRESEVQAKLSAEAIDVTLPGRGRGKGGIHPVMRTWERIEQDFGSIGFNVADGPEIELTDDRRHWTKSEPSTVRAGFFLYRWQGFARQAVVVCAPVAGPVRSRHYAGLHELPVRVIAPGRTYRVDSDATHSPMFHQVERPCGSTANISFADLKGVYLNFVRAFFETDNLQVRFRPYLFPFTEPSAEIDIAFGSGPLKGKWLEVSGAGQVHPNVLKNMGIDSRAVYRVCFRLRSGKIDHAALRHQ